jgi:phenylpropionate dioxygenase-like ring-hydroxylating dioxygenase large terminal subunit
MTMRHERQVELLRRVERSGPRFTGLHAPSSRTNDAAAYTDPERFALEQRVLFRGGPVFFGLGADLAEPGSYRAMRMDGIPLVVVRQSDGSLRAFVNACRHRGAPVVDPASSGNGLSAFSCPYHSWTYDLDGTLRARPASGGAFDDVTMNCDLLARPVAEKYGLVFVRPEGVERIDVDEVLGGAEDDLGAFGLDGYTHVETRINQWEMNWKLFFDTFSESYHIRTLHRDSIAPAFNSDCVIFDAFGRNLLSVGLRANVRDEFEKPVEEWSLLPYGTIQYFLVPNGLVVHQLDHVEVWIVEPLSVDRTRTTTSVYAPQPPATDKQRNYFVKNLDLLLAVTGAEDFALMEQIQESLASGALPEVVYGTVEPPLIYFHDQIDRAIGVAG